MADIKPQTKQEKIERERLDQAEQLEKDLQAARDSFRVPNRPLPRFEKDVKHQVETVLSHWGPYVPTWTGATTNPGVGKGTLSGRFVKQGVTVFATITMVAGSDTTFGSGRWFFSVPFPAAAFGQYYVGNAFAVDEGTTASIGIATIEPGDNRVSVWLHSNANPVKSDNPWTWATGDRLSIQLVYETA